MILDNLGITVKVSEANEAYARALGKSASELTEAEKKTAFYNAAMAAAAAKVAEIGEGQLTLKDRVQQGLVAWQNFTDQLAVGISRSPVFAAGMEALGQAVRAAVGPDQKGLVKDLVHAIEGLAIGAVNAGGVVVEVARFITNAFHGVKVLFNAVLEVIAAGVEKVAAFHAQMAENASALPVVGKLYGQLGEKFRAIADTAQALRLGFQEQKESALDSAAATNAGFDKARQVLDAVGAAMQRARDSAKETALTTTQAGRDMGGALDDVNTRTKENTEKIAEAYRKLNEEVTLLTKVGLERRLAELGFARDKEIADLKKLKEITRAELDERVALVNEKYRLLTQAAIASGDEVRSRQAQLQQELLLLETTGVQQRLLQLELERQKKIQGLIQYKDANRLAYEEMVNTVNLAFGRMTADALAHYSLSEAAAAVHTAKLKTEEGLRVQAAREAFLQILMSGEATYEQLKRAYERWADAEKKLAQEKHKLNVDLLAQLMSSTSQILRSIFGKNKAAAIVAAIIDTAAAVVKTLAAYPFPYNLIPAAAVAAAGYAQIRQIQNTHAEGFAEGTRGLDFMDFGPATLTVLHDQEAVVPRGGGHLLAAEIADAMGGARDDGALLVAVREMLHEISELPIRMRRAWKDALQTT